MQLAVSFGFFPPDPADRDARRRRWVAFALLLSLLIHGGLTLWLFDARRRAGALHPPPPVIEAMLDRVRPAPPPAPPATPPLPALQDGGGGGGSPPAAPPTPIHRSPAPDPSMVSPFEAPTPMPPMTFEPVIVPPAPMVEPDAVGEGLARGDGDGVGDGSGRGPGSGTGAGGGSGSGVGAGAGSGGRVPVVVPADWRRPPRPPEFTRFYPARARREGVNGHALLDCLATRDGRARDCRLLSETPAGYGFGQAALGEARYFALRPMTVDGQARDSRIRIGLGYVTPKPTSRRRR